MASVSGNDDDVEAADDDSEVLNPIRLFRLFASVRTIIMQLVWEEEID